MRRAQAGLGLVELTVAVTVLAVAAALAVPSLRGLGQAWRLEAARGALVGALHLARAEALRRAQRVTVCISDDALRCGDGGGWERGWIVFVDHQGAAQPASPRDVIAVQGPLDGLRIRGNPPLAGYVSYNALGWPRRVDGGLQMGHITLCTAHGPGRRVVLSSAGRLREQADENCQPSAAG